jgi:hypothetical protein
MDIADAVECGKNCWNCGQPGIGVQYGANWHTYACPCGCGWTDQKEQHEIIEGSLRKARINSVLAQYRAAPAVDFTKPDVLSSPALGGIHRGLDQGAHLLALT